MKVNEAIHCMKVAIGLEACEECPIFGETGTDHCYEDACRLALKALEKQIPKKPIVWENKSYDAPVPNDDWGYECPCCGNRDIDYPEHHCTCGQKLDWGDE